LIAARKVVGQNAAIEHSLGLQYVRAGQMPQALSALENAARLQPDNARYSYVYAVALDGVGESAHAIKVLQDVHARHPYDRDALIGLIGFNKAQGNSKAAMGYARKLVEMDPRYGSAQQIIEQVSR
jgi:Flp pilus assembly protein TadD